MWQKSQAARVDGEHYRTTLTETKASIVQAKRKVGWVFQIKCLAKQLPTKATLHKRRPKVYETNTCISCLRKEESQDHLAFCEVYGILWKRVRNEVCRYVITKVKEKEDLLTEMKQHHEIF